MPALRNVPNNKDANSIALMHEYLPVAVSLNTEAYATNHSSHDDSVWSYQYVMSGVPF